MQSPKKPTSKNQILIILQTTHIIKHHEKNTIIYRSTKINPCWKKENEGMCVPKRGIWWGNDGGCSKWGRWEVYIEVGRIWRPLFLVNRNLIWMGMGIQCNNTRTFVFGNLTILTFNLNKEVFACHRVPSTLVIRFTITLVLSLPFV